ncbi:hypothetical protein HPB50_022986 [Hyalomma asiaticum]|uniref:Uncharacterized protein n=1 Tax=Hyalomma asiaticum TaxID=266040 RepID=A0ACB7S286_HYAAI|nr:hypothetical protein HPB50_022986 [Hyalomma asiaticum]
MAEPSAEHFIHILGMTVLSNVSNARIIAKLAMNTNKAVCLIKRVGSRHHGLSEDDLIHLVKAFVLWHFCYAADMYNWQKTEWDELSFLLKKTAKRALGVAIRTHTKCLFQLGVDNTLEDIAEGQERTTLYDSRLPRSVDAYKQGSVARSQAEV